MALETITTLTYDDYALIPSDGRRHEIIDGEHYVNPAPNSKHQRVVVNLVMAMAAFVKRHGLGHVYVAPYDVVLSSGDVLQPDVLFITSEREALITDANLQGAPNLVIEILSPSTRKLDQTVKLRRYDRFGVDEYWIVDPESETVAIYRRDAMRLVSVDPGDPLISPLLPGFSLDMRDVFAE
ncbi:MAG TPA: Uma2 family endonuclease [Thermoanaerobaculia bacterium]